MVAPNKKKTTHLIFLAMFTAAVIITATLLPVATTIELNDEHLSIGLRFFRAYASTAIDVQVNASANDAYYSTVYAYDAGSQYAYVGYASAVTATFHTFCRFTGITIPAGATITVAYLQAYGYTNTSPTVPWGTPTMKIAAVDEDNPAAPTTDAEFVTDAGILSTAKIDWDATFSGGGTLYTSPSIVTIITELLASYAISNDALMFQIRNDGGTTNQGNRIGQYDYPGNTYGIKLHIEYTVAPSISNTPSSKAFGILEDNATHWSKGSAPTFPIDDSECFFTLTNNGSVAVNLTANATNPTGGIGATCVDSAPGANQIRISLYTEGDGSSDNTTIKSGVNRSLYSNLAPSAELGWEVKLEIGTSTETPPTQKTFTIRIIAATA